MKIYNSPSSYREFTGKDRDDQSHLRHFHSFTGHTGPVWALMVTSDILISGSSDKTIKVGNF